MIKRRHFIKIGASAGIGLMLPWDAMIPKGFAQVLAPGLLDPALQPKFMNAVPNALAPGFIYQLKNKSKLKYKVGMYPISQNLGLVGADGLPKPTPMWGYGDSPNTGTYPGKTFEVKRGDAITVRWENKLTGPGGPVPHLLPVDTSLHWCYSLHGYMQYSIAQNGVPVVPHVHGGRTESDSDGLPEYFFSPDWAVQGPRWVKKDYVYENDQEAGTVWYHDHALGITRLNVYVGLAGFYIVRDNFDTGKQGNPAGLPTYPYEAAFAIQDKMFKENATGGTIDLFFPAFPGDPAWTDFITEEGLADTYVPQPSALAEFFGDHILVNGVAWPKMQVEPRQYRVRLLNGCDSRFLVCELRAVPITDTDFVNEGNPIPFLQVGADNGLLPSADSRMQLTMGPGERADLVIDFSNPALAGKRIILKNIGPDAPFGGDIPADPDDLFSYRQTNRIMAFDVVLPKDTTIPDTGITAGTSLRSSAFTYDENDVVRVRKLALFEGTDEFGRLQPLLGVIDDTLESVPTVIAGLPIATPSNGSLGWFQDITEQPRLGDIEEWEIYNMTMDAHPIHVHLVSFQIVNRQPLDMGEVSVIEKPQAQHNSIPGDLTTYGTGGIVTIGANPFAGPPVAPEANELGPKDTAQMYPEQVTRIRMKFDKLGRYVWHCHILSHEDHEMMRPYEVLPAAPAREGQIAAVEGYDLMAYPNPFQDHTRVRIDLPEFGRVRVQVFDMSGRMVTTLTDQVYESGTHVLDWNAGSIASGIFVARLTVNGTVVATAKMIKQA